MARELTENQRMFVEIYTADGKKNAVQAYMQAYDNQNYKTAGAASSDLLRNAKVQEAIRKILKPSEKKLKITREEIIQDLIDIKNAQKNKNTPSALKAIELLNKMLGYNEADKVDVKSSFNLFIPGVTVQEKLEDKLTEYEDYHDNLKIMEPRNSEEPENNIIEPRNLEEQDDRILPDDADDLPESMREV